MPFSPGAPNWRLATDNFGSLCLLTGQSLACVLRLKYAVRVGEDGKIEAIARSDLVRFFFAAIDNGESLSRVPNERATW